MTGSLAASARGPERCVPGWGRSDRAPLGTRGDRPGTDPGPSAGSARLARARAPACAGPRASSPQLLRVAGPRASPRSGLRRAPPSSPRARACPSPLRWRPRSGWSCVWPRPRDSSADQPPRSAVACGLPPVPLLPVTALPSARGRSRDARGPPASSPPPRRPCGASRRDRRLHSPRRPPRARACGWRARAPPCGRPLPFKAAPSRAPPSPRATPARGPLGRAPRAPGSACRLGPRRPPCSSVMGLLARTQPTLVAARCREDLLRSPRASP
jgi:hypothetical protein